MTSKIGYDLVRFLNVKTKGFNMYGNRNWSCIDFKTADRVTPLQYFFSKKEDIFRDSPNQCPKDNHLVPDHLQECFEMAIHLSRLFILKKCGYDLLMINKSPEEMIQILSRILAEKCTSFAITEALFVEGQHWMASQIIDTRVLNYLMDNLKLDAHLAINASFPVNYTHENLFKFRSFTHSCASWVTMEHLKSLRNVGRLCFMNMNISSKNLNIFIHYWITCQEDMMKSIEITINDENSSFEDEVLDQLTTVVLMENGDRSPTHLIKSCNNENRKRIIGKLSFSEFRKGITLKTMTDNGRYKAQLEVLELMEKKNDLEKNLRGIEENEARIKNDPSNDEQILKELMDRKKAIREELFKNRMKLLALNN